VQTANDLTLQRIRRGHDWECSRSAIVRLAEAGISCAVHLIFGLPGESDADFSASAAAVAKLPVSGVKFHNLHVLRSSPLAADFMQKPFEVLDEHDYAEAVIDAIRRMPPRIPVMRLQTDTLPENLVAPRWLMKKGQFTDYVERQMRRRGLRQGDLYVENT
jgi:radical SAM protein (TIGR01212 family)